MDFANLSSSLHLYWQLNPALGKVSKLISYIKLCPHKASAPRKTILSTHIPLIRTVSKHLIKMSLTDKILLCITHNTCFLHVVQPEVQLQPTQGAMQVLEVEALCTHQVLGQPLDISHLVIKGLIFQQKCF